MQRLATVALVLFVIFVGGAVYSAASLRPSSTSAGNVSFASIGNNTFRVTALVNLSNPGFYPITHLQLEAHVDDPRGALLAAGSSPYSDIAPGTTGMILLQFNVDISSVADAVSLLTHDAKLSAYVRLHATYASVFDIAVDAPSNLSWGAPLAGLNVTPATPVAQPNGTVNESIRISFADHARFPVTGSFNVRVTNPSGVACGSGALPANVPPGGAFNRTMTVALAFGCNVQGGAVVGSFVGPDVYVVLPPEPLP
ncbi:MAG: hypothetical protein L3K15_02855 [Thermoplasmata archaeon]|nr:hypothetical protein [Thermoplasmata archaeon]